METKIPNANPVAGLTIQEELLLPMTETPIAKRIRKRIKYIRPAMFGVDVSGAIRSASVKYK